MSLKVKGLYANGMVLQRGMKNCAFGTADANSQVKLNFRNADFSSVCDAEGNWKIEFEVGDAGGPFELKISSGSDEALFKDVYVGEVWVSSGQSNAQLPMSRMYFSYREEFELPANQNIRIITVPITYAFDGEKDSVENPQWNCACPEHLANMAGTSYFFAKKLQSDLGVPVGIINPAQGGSPINSWVNKEVLEKMNQEDFLATLKIYEDPKNIEDKKASVAKAQGEWAQKILDSDLGLKENWQETPVSSIDNDWSSCTIPGFIDELDSAGIVWLKKSVNLTAAQVEKLNSKKSWIWLGTIVDADKVYINGTFVGETPYSYPPRRYVIPAGTLKEGEITREKTLAVKQFISDLTKDTERLEQKTEKEEEKLVRAEEEFEKELKTRKNQPSNKKTKKKMSNAEALKYATPMENMGAGSNNQKKSATLETKPLIFEPGAKVLAGNNSEGILIDEARKGLWNVQFGSVKMTVKQKDLKLVSSPEDSILATPSISYDLSTSGGEVERPVFELRLLGMRGEEAIKALEHQIDLAALNNFPHFSVIHGKGDGILQQLVKDYLSHSPMVKEFSFAPAEDGGAGKTYVTLK